MRGGSALATLTFDVLAMLVKPGGGRWMGQGIHASGCSSTALSMNNVCVFGVHKVRDTVGNDSPQDRRFSVAEKGAWFQCCREWRAPWHVGFHVVCWLGA